MQLIVLTDSSNHTFYHWQFSLSALT